MTLENAKKWYAIFLEQGRLEEAENLAQKRPELKSEVKVEKPKKVNSKKEEKGE